MDSRRDNRDASAGSPARPWAVRSEGSIGAVCSAPDLRTEDMETEVRCASAELDSEGISSAWDSARSKRGSK